MPNQKPEIHYLEVARCFTCNGTAISDQDALGHFDNVGSGRWTEKALREMSARLMQPSDRTQSIDLSQPFAPSEVTPEVVLEVMVENLQALSLRAAGFKIPPPGTRSLKELLKEAGQKASTFTPSKLHQAKA